MQKSNSAGTKVVTGKVRLSYVNLFTPRAINEGEEPKYSLSILIPKDDNETLSKIEAAVNAAKENGRSIWGGKIPDNLRTPLRDGDMEHAELQEYDGHYFINANSKYKPGVVDKKLKPILDASEVYGGCYGRVSINFFAYNQRDNKGIGCGLQNVQKLEDGEHFGNFSAPGEDFEIIGEEEDSIF